MLKSLGTLGASIWLISLGILTVIWLVLLVIAKTSVERGDDLTIVIILVVFGLIYYFIFRLMGGWRASTWEAPGGLVRKTLLFLISLPGLIVGFAVVLIFVLWLMFGSESDSPYSRWVRIRKPVSSKEADPGV